MDWATAFGGGLFSCSVWRKLIKVFTCMWALGLRMQRDSGCKKNNHGIIIMTTIWVEIAQGPISNWVVLRSFFFFYNRLCDSNLMHFWSCTIRSYFRDAFVDHTVIVCQIRAYERVHLMERPRKGDLPNQAAIANLRVHLMKRPRKGDDLQFRFVSGQVVHNAQQVARENGLPIIFKAFLVLQNCQRHSQTSSGACLH